MTTSTTASPRAAAVAPVRRLTPSRPAVRSTAGAGLALAVLSAAAFASSGPMAASLLEAGWSPAATSLLRIGGGAVVMLPVTVVALIRRRPSVADLRVATLYGVVAVAGAQFSFFNAVQYLSVGVALLLEYLAPILMVLATWTRSRQTPGWQTLLGTVVSVMGLVLVLDLPGAAHLSAPGVAWGLAAAVCLSSYFVLSARELQTMSPVALAGTGLVVGGVALALLGASGLLPLVASTAPVVLLGTSVSWLAPAGVMILVATVVAYSSGIVAAKRLGSRVASFVGLSEVVCAVVFAWLLLGQTLGIVQLLGGVGILAGVVLVRSDRVGT